MIASPSYTEDDMPGSVDGSSQLRPTDMVVRKLPPTRPDGLTPTPPPVVDVGGWLTIFESLTMTNFPTDCGMVAFFVNTSAIARRRDLYQLLSTIIHTCQRVNLPLDTVLCNYDVAPQMDGTSGLRESVVRSVLASDGWTLARFVHDGFVTYAASPSFERDIYTVAELTYLPRLVQFPPFVHEEDMELFFSFIGALWATVRLHGGVGEISLSCEYPARVFNRSTGQFTRCLFDAEIYVQYGGRVLVTLFAITDADPPSHCLLQPQSCAEETLEFLHPDAESPFNFELPFDVSSPQGGPCQCPRGAALEYDSDGSIIPTLSATHNHLGRQQCTTFGHWHPGP